MQGTWESALVASYFGLYDGGTAGVIWLFVAVWLCMIATIACMVRQDEAHGEENEKHQAKKSLLLVQAELASMAPTAGGELHGHSSIIWEMDL